MDAYDATKIVFSRIQSLDPENAAKIIGFLLIQDHGEKEMIRLAFGPESLLQSVVFNARRNLGLLPPSPTAASPSPAPPQSNPFDLARQNSSSRLLARPPPVAVSFSSWAQPSPLSRTTDEIHAGGGEELIEEIHQLGGTGELVYPEECWSPEAPEIFPYGMGWGAAAKSGAQRRGLNSFSDVAGLGTDPIGLGPDPIGLGWKPCLYFAKGYCKNGSSCRYLHGLACHAATLGKMEPVVDRELLLRSKSQRYMTSFPNSPTGPLPHSPSTATGKCMNYLLQQQLLQNENQRVVATAAALMLGREDQHKFIVRPRMERSDFAGMMNPGSRQIYLTFPADSTFQEEDVSNYFSIYGQVQDVRIPYQQKRMFGFVTFLYPETVKLILAIGNPHFVCDSRVLVKPYKEKGKLSDKKQQCDRGDFFGCTTPTGVDARDHYDLQPLGARKLYAGNNQNALLMRKLEEQQELQYAIDLQQQRFIGLQLLPPTFTTASVVSPPPCPIITTTTTLEGDKKMIPGPASAAALSRVDQEEKSPQDDSDFKASSPEHNLPDSPFASPTKYAFPSGDSFSLVSETEAASTAATASTSASALLASTLLPTTSTGSIAPKSCFLPIPRFSSRPGEVGL